LLDSNFPVINNLEEGLKQTDGIWICTPTSTHKELIMKLAPLGNKKKLNIKNIYSNLLIIILN